MKDALVVMAYTLRDVQCGTCGWVMHNIGHYTPAKKTPPTPAEPFTKYVRCHNQDCAMHDVVFEVEPDIKLKRYEAK